MKPTHAMNRARGAMLGMAVGDALGAPLEGLGPQQIRTHYNVVDDYVDGTLAWRRKAERWRKPGLYTDDTQQALSVAETLLECGEMRTVHLAEIWRHMYRTRVDESGRFPNGVHRNIGRNFRLALEQLSAGKPLESIAQASAGLGAAVRVAPLAIAFREDADHLYHSVVQASMVTHCDIRSVAAALACAFATARLLNGEEKSPAFLFHVAADTARCENRLAQEFPDQLAGLMEHRHAISRCIAHVERTLEMNQEQAFLAILDEARNHGPSVPCKRPTMGFAPAALASCFYLLISCGTFHESLVEMINQGGDADSTGSILGTMAGAHYGRDGIPEDWVTPLLNAEGVDARACALVLPPEKYVRKEIPDLIETEKRLCLMEARHREGLRAASKFIASDLDRSVKQHRPDTGDDTKADARDEAL